MSVFVLSEPHLRRRESVTVETTLRGLTIASGLILGFWATGARRRVEVG